MADIKISELPVITTVAGTDVIPIVQSGVTDQVALANLGGAGFVYYNAGTISASGIQFPATQVASSNPNMLDDYEEGTYSPALTFGTLASGITYSLQTGWYRKVGSLVEFGGAIVLTSKGVSTGAATVSLPFTTNAGCIGCAFLSLEAVTFANAFHAYYTGATAYIRLMEITEAGVRTALDDTNFANNSTVVFGGSFFV